MPILQDDNDLRICPKRAVLIGVLISLAVFVNADQLVEVSRTEIALGPGRDAIGLEEGGGEHWKPLFFSVDDAGFIHIPDFFKNRIAVFSADGRLAEEKLCTRGLSPRINYFSRTPQGSYVSFGDGVLSLINRYGSLRWQYTFGYGVIPAQIVPAQSALFIILPAHLDKDGRAIVFDYGSATPLGRYGKEAGGRQIPLVQWNETAAFSPRLADMQAVAGKPDVFKYGGKAIFLSADPDGNSLWSEKSQSGETILIFDRTGASVSQGTIFFPEGFPGTGFWTYADALLLVYKNYFTKDRLFIVGYRFKKGLI